MLDNNNIKEVKIVPPKGYEIDKENSTFECIKFKPVIFRNNIHSNIKGYYVDIDGMIEFRNDTENIIANRNLFATKKQAKSALAMAQISQIMANDLRFGGIITDEEWKNENLGKFCIERQYSKITYRTQFTCYDVLAFHTIEQRELFFKENEDLVKDYLMID